MLTQFDNNFILQANTKCLTLFIISPNTINYTNAFITQPLVKCAFLKVTKLELPSSELGSLLLLDRAKHIISKAFKKVRYIAIVRQHQLILNITSVRLASENDDSSICNDVILIEMVQFYDKVSISFECSLQY